MMDPDKSIDATKAQDSHEPRDSGRDVRANRRRVAAILAIAFVVVAVIVSTQVTVFVVQPIGAVPDGRTVVMSRLRNMKFIDSADAMCLRIQDGVNLLCRGMVMGRVLEEATIFVRRPYSRTLYLISTGGVEFDR